MSSTDPKIAYAWSRIRDVTENHGSLAHPELRALIGVWTEQKAELEEQEVIKDFNEQLLRRWAVETGLIERLYTLDRGVTELLVERGLEASLIPHGAVDGNPEQVISMIRDHHKAVEGLFDFVASRRPLSTSYIKELHAVLTASQDHTEAIDQFGKLVKIPLRRGDYKQQPNNPRREDGSIHEYCPPEHVDAEMDRLVELHLRHEEMGVCPEVEAAWLHHRFTQIHPFQDGNGRVARALATLIFLRAGWLPLVVTNDHRESYIDALEAADHGDLEPLVDLFSRIEKRAFLDALSVAREVQQRDRRVDHVIASIRDTFEKRRESLRREWDASKQIAQTLQSQAEEQLEAIAQEFKDQIAPLAPPGEHFEFFVDKNEPDDERSHWFRFQLIDTAKELDYFANFGVFHAWVRLVMDTSTRAEILLSFHGIGHEYRGLLVGTACFYRREAAGEDSTTVSDVIPLSDEPFQINYKEPEGEVVERFRAWIDPVLITGLELMRNSV